jgi:lipoprotein-anchoring transpeptidase ErfK/SrfK
MRWGMLSAALLAAAIAVTPAAAHIDTGESCPGERAVSNPATAYAAYASGRVEARSSPGGKRLQSFARMNQNGVRTVFGVLAVVTGPDCRPLGYRVRLPIRPNGATGFVPLDAVTLHAVQTRIEIDLSARRLLFFRGERRLLATSVAIGAPGTPTPTGYYYVNQRLRPDDPSGPFGPGAIGISAFSPTLTHWAQGGPIAVHGTDDPSSVGRVISHGCLRVQNPVLRRLFRATQTGSPVVIHS